MSEAKSLGEMVLYQAADGGPALEVRLEHDTVWLSLNQIPELFDRDKSVISRHLRNVFASGELEREATVARNATVQREGRRQVVRDVERDSPLTPPRPVGRARTISRSGAVLIEEGKPPPSPQQGRSCRTRSPRALHGPEKRIGLT